MYGDRDQLNNDIIIKPVLEKKLRALSMLTCKRIQVSYDPRSYKHNFSNCVEKHEKLRPSTG